MKRTIATAAILLLLSLDLSAQSATGFHSVFRTLLLGRSHSASGEAMGRTGLLAGNGTGNHLINPSSLQFEKGISATYSTGDNFYAYDKGSLTYYSAAVKLHKLFSLGVSRKSFDTGSIDDHLNSYTSDLYTVSYAAQLFYGVNVGLNWNYFEQDVFRFYFPSFVFEPEWSMLDAGSISREGNYFSIGLSKNFVFETETKFRELRFGASYLNLTGNTAEGTVESFSENIREILAIYDMAAWNVDLDFPKTVKLGFAYLYRYSPPGRELIRSLSAKAAIEYYHASAIDMEGMNLGIEFTAMKFLNIRVGLYRELTRDNIFQYGGQTKYHKVTRGIGVRIPDDWIPAQLPISTSIDYVHFKEPYQKHNEFIRSGTYQGFQVTLQYKFTR